MAKVDNPRFDAVTLMDCDECPYVFGGLNCIVRDCPRNMEEYAEAVKLAEQEASK